MRNKKQHINLLHAFLNNIKICQKTVLFWSHFLWSYLNVDIKQKKFEQRWNMVHFKDISYLKDANLDKSEKKNSRNHLAQVCRFKQISVSYECLCRSWFRRPGRKRTCTEMWAGPNDFYWNFIRQKFISALRREPPRILLADLNSLRVLEIC